MLTYEQALKRILGATPAPRMAVVSLRESLGLVLARPMTARCALPQFDNSAVDGYAVRLPAARRRDGRSAQPCGRVRRCAS
jgi:molybdopterin molybdotransferase